MSTDPASHPGQPGRPGRSGQPGGHDRPLRSDEGIRPVGDGTRRVDDGTRGAGNGPRGAGNGIRRMDDRAAGRDTPRPTAPATPQERRLTVVEGDEHRGPPPPGGGTERTADRDRDRDALPEGPLALLARGAWQTVLLAGVAALVLGVLALAWPGETLRVVGILFGVYLVVSGVMQLVAAFGTHASTALRVMAFISGALCILLGLLCFRSALQSILLLALWIGIGWLFRGITQAVAAGSDEAMPARGWQIGLGVISALAGIVLIVSPLTSIALLTYLAGAWLLAVGVIEIVTAMRIRHRAKHLPAGA
ncbi:HdeD family acid-resistance protein [Streptomyces sp. 184]|uniref:HdeD family acid-resistance protein n=1 Tax=Streptomyces sp. 184 TaxID=1827526 RepID=UPI003891771D